MKAATERERESWWPALQRQKRERRIERERESCRQIESNKERVKE